MSKELPEERRLFKMVYKDNKGVPHIGEQVHMYKGEYYIPGQEPTKAVEIITWSYYDK